MITNYLLKPGTLLDPLYAQARVSEEDDHHSPWAPSSDLQGIRFDSRKTLHGMPQPRSAAERDEQGVRVWK